MTQDEACKEYKELGMVLTEEYGEAKFFEHPEFMFTSSAWAGNQRTNSNKKNVGRAKRLVEEAAIRAIAEFCS